MRIGLVDLGTNSVRYDVYELRGRNRIKSIHSGKEMIRLGEGLFERGRLSPVAVRRLVRSIRQYKRLTDSLGVDRVAAFATSALREARDAERVKRLIRENTGIPVRVITGNEEARLIALGITSHERRCQGRYAIIDIGGGSTEIIICDGHQILERGSLPLGVARVQQLLLKGLPPKDMGAYLAYVGKLRRSAIAKTLSKHRVERAIGSSGTVKALSKIMKALHRDPEIRRGELAELRQDMERMGKRDLRGIPGMSERRVDLILAGALILEDCMDLVGAKRVAPTPYALRDGLILDWVSKALAAEN